MVIMKTYVCTDPALGEIRYRDEKRYLWLLSVLFPLIPLVGMGLMAWNGLFRHRHRIIHLKHPLRLSNLTGKSGLT